MRSSKQSDAKTILGFVQSFLGRSPGFCDPNVTLHVVHDSESVDMPKVWRGVLFHAFPPRTDRVAGDARYPLFAKVLNREASKWSERSVAACATERSRFREVSGARPVLFHPLLVPCGRLRALASSSLPSVRYYSPSSPARRLFPANLVFTRVRSLAAPSSLTVQMTSSCKSSFSRAVHVALGAHLSTESAAFLLQGVDSLEKARQALLGSLLFLKSGEWAYIPLDSSAVSFKNDALHRPNSVPISRARNYTVLRV